MITDREIKELNKYTSNKEDFLFNLRRVISCGIGFRELSARTLLGWESLYKSLSPKGNPKFNTISAILSALDVEIVLTKKDPLRSKSQQYLRKNSLLHLYPELVLGWHPTKNLPITPNDVLIGTRKKFWWICSNNHEFLKTIKKESKNIECDTCKGKNGMD